MARQWTPSPWVPSIESEETITSYFDRAYLLSANINRDAFSEKLLGFRISTASNGRLDAGSSRMALNLSRYGVRFPRSLFEDHCIGAIGLPFCDSVQRQKKQRTPSVSHNTGEWRSFGMKSTRIRCQSHFCPACVENDLDELGYTYWRRTPQIHGVTFCPSHHVRLISQCPVCRTSLIESGLPTTTCVNCQYEVRPNYLDPLCSSEAVEFRFSDAVEGIYTGRITGPMTSTTIRGRIDDLFSSLGTALGGGMTDMVSGLVNPDYLAKLGMTFNRNETRPWPVSLLASDQILGDAAAQSLIYAVLSHDKRRESMFLPSFPDSPRWKVVSYLTRENYGGRYYY